MKELINSLLTGKDTSSKRATALYIMFVLVTVVVGFMIYFKYDLQTLLLTLLAFAGALWGMSEYGKNIKQRNDEKETKD